MLKISIRKLSSIISCRDLNKLIESQAQVHILDSSVNPPAASLQYHFAQRIPSSKFFDLNKVVDVSSNIPYTMPFEETFNRFAGALGIQNDTTPIVCYDNQGVFSSPRAWFTFKYFQKK